MKLMSDTSDTMDRIFKAVAIYVESGHRVQSKVFLPYRDYFGLLAEAKSSSLGRSFVKYGFRFCQMDVFKYAGNEIVIA